MEEDGGMMVVEVTEGGMMVVEVMVEVTVEVTVEVMIELMVEVMVEVMVVVTVEATELEVADVCSLILFYLVLCVAHPVNVRDIYEARVT